VYNMVMLCQHCEHAPCEIVCPVYATVHDSEGLNVMVYNRCVGTKYCSNNCPYKVRRFNFLQYQDETTPSLKLGRNPDVTVRARGVMEKCTFCVQRINEARIDADRAETRITDGQVQTACQQVCPTQAIIFGDINDPNAAVTQLKQEPLTYTSLDALNTRPRVSYMATLKNLSPALPEPVQAEG
jgi:Fe-S-cluster-containing dehydrogenase component